MALDLWRQVGGEAADAAGLSVEGRDPALPSLYRVGTAAGACVGAATLAAAALWRDRGGPRPEVGADLRSAATSFRSERLLRIDGAAPAMWDPVSGDYPTADGWVRLHTNFAHHRHAALAALGAEPDRAAVAAAVAARTAEDVQEAVVAAGGCATAMRSPEAWRHHPQGRAAAALPLVSLAPVGADGVADAPPRPLPPADRPLAGVRVLDLTRVIAGPVCGRVLASHGADVLHVGAPHVPTFAELDLDTGVGKRSCHLDLRAEADRAALRALVAEADVVVQSYRPGALAGLGFAAEALAALRPGLVVVDLSAWGAAGPWAGRRGFDSLVQMATGIAQAAMAASGADRPRPLPAQALDHGTGWLAALGVVAGLRRRHAEGGSWRVQVSLARTAAWLEGLGRIDGLGAPDPTAEDVAALLVTDDAPAGRVTHVGPVGHLAGAEPRWDRPAPVPGGDAPAWA